MAKFPKDAPKRRVVKALQTLGSRLVREREHISMVDPPPVQDCCATMTRASLRARDGRKK